ncbi:MAG: c-type cytochrome [Sphingomonadales bacterium]
MAAAGYWAKIGLATLAIVFAMNAGARVAAAGAAGGGDSPAKPSHGRQLFTDWSCSSCHALQDAGAEGHVGPSLDGDPNLTKALVVDRVTNGQGAMPGFGGQLSDDEIAELAAYVVEAAKK